MHNKLNENTDNFAKLGEVLRTYSMQDFEDRYDAYYKILNEKIRKAEEQNPWFTKKNIYQALKNIGLALKKDQIEHWLASYPELKKQDNSSLRIGVVNAGNIPLVGFHDLLTVLITGNIYIGKLSSKDKELPEAIREIIIDIDPGLKNRIHFTEDRLKDFDAIIATGSDNASRYFDYYFGKYPHIIRKNRNSAAVLTGNEKPEELHKLADDLFLYFGLGCRNVSKLYLPEDFSPEKILDNLSHYESMLIQHNKYMNNYEYNRTVFLMNKVPHLDNGFVLLKEDASLPSPIGTIHYETYSDINQVKESLKMQKDNIQCIVSHSDNLDDAISFGESQKPRLWDYADNVDTIRFILSLQK